MQTLQVWLLEEEANNEESVANEDICPLCTIRPNKETLWLLTRGTSLANLHS